MTICIIGLGYVDLLLALQYARSGAKVVGMDIDQRKVDLSTSGPKLYQTHRAGED